MSTIFRKTAILLVVCFMACTPETETSEQFVARLVSYLSIDDEAGLFKECYVNSKDEIRRMMKEFSGNTEILPEHVDDLYTALLEDEHRILQKYKKEKLSSWENVEIDSITESSFPMRNFGNEEIPFTPGYRRSLISIFVKSDGHQHKVDLPAVDLHTGQWKLMGHPRITLIE